MRLHDDGGGEWGRCTLVCCRVGPWLECRTRTGQGRARRSSLGLSSSLLPLDLCIKISLARLRIRQLLVSEPFRLCLSEIGGCRDFQCKQRERRARRSCLACAPVIVPSRAFPRRRPLCYPKPASSPLLSRSFKPSRLRVHGGPCPESACFERLAADTEDSLRPDGADATAAAYSRTYRQQQQLPGEADNDVDEARQQQR